MNLLKRPNRINQTLLKICICKRFSSNISYNGPSIFIEDLPWSGEDSTKVVSLQNLLQNCARKRIPMSGMACHCHIIRLGLQLDTLTSNILINFYSKCGLVGSARKVFDEMPARSLVSWNTMIGTYTRDGDEDEGLDLFVCMQREGSRFSEFTVSSVLCACARKFAVFECRQLHCFSVKMGMDLNMFVGTGLVDVYAKSGFVEDALRVFEIMPERNEVTWSSMIAGYVQNGLYEEALVLYRKTQVIGLENNQFTTSSILAACAGLAALIQGNQMHSVIHKCGFASNVFIASSLIDLYSKCGSIKDAYLVFSSAEEGNLVIWNAMISGFSRHARSTEAMILVEKMQQLGMRPNEVTYVALLSLCGHLGLVERGRKYFNLMRKEHYLSPNVLHYSCMVDVLGRAGLIEEAKDLIDNEMPFEATAPIWGSLLASCRVYGNAEVAEIAATHLFELEPNNAGNHVLLSNTYAVTKRWDDVLRARKVLKDSEVKKEKGKSWIEVRDKVHTFMVGEIAHPRINEIYSRLEDILGEMEKIDYTGDTVHDLHDVEENRKRELLKHHSEKLAFTFGLMCLPNSAPIRIMKNLRICGDCHSFMKLASKLTEKEIVVRDINRFHHFNNGFCSCGDFW